MIFNQHQLSQQDLASCRASKATLLGSVVNAAARSSSTAWLNMVTMSMRSMSCWFIGYQSYIDALKGFRNTRFGRGPIGGGYYAGTSSISANVPFGAATMATPDGRKAMTPLAEGASPASGSDMCGPTAVFNSLGKLPTEEILGGVLLNQKLNPRPLESPRIIQLMQLLRAFRGAQGGGTCNTT